MIKKFLKTRHPHKKKRESVQVRTTNTKKMNLVEQLDSALLECGNGEIG